MNNRYLTFNDFCEEYCDRMYDKRISFENQSTGYKLLREMVEKNIKPSTIEEYESWRNSPTLEELFNPPPLKHLTFLHKNLRPYIRKNWKTIKKLPL